ncbi:MAG: hypothetical protein WCJ88_11330 [Actinomycetes bacterium]
MSADENTAGAKPTVQALMLEYTVAVIAAGAGEIPANVHISATAKNVGTTKRLVRRSFFEMLIDFTT